jgi:hypothetical protein
LKAYDFNKLWKQNGLRLRSDAGYKPLSDEKKTRKRRRESEGFMAELVRGHHGQDVV